MRIRPRVIPVLTIDGIGLFRTRSFKSPVYVGDPLNALRIFNDKEVDELFIFDISKEPSIKTFELVKEMAPEAFMPMGYGGHLNSLHRIEEVFRAGFEKVVLNTWAEKTPDLLKEAVSAFGGQSIVVSIDVSNSWLGKNKVFTSRGKHKTHLDPIAFAMKCVDFGVGEIIIRSIPHDGQMQGMHLNLISRVSESVSVPVVAVGGAGSHAHLQQALQAGAHAVAAGSMFVFQGPRRGVLINYLSENELNSLVQ
jgi:imidazole glycerol-phosphate synthase subunit HisF